MDVDAWGMEATGVLTDDGFAFRTNLECFDMEMRKLQTCFDGNAACAETDVPKGVTMGQIKGLKGEQTDGHLGDHLFATVQKGKLIVRNAKQRMQ